MDFLINVSILIFGRLNLFYFLFFLPNCTLADYLNDGMWNACNVVINITVYITKIWQSFHCWILTTCNSNIFDLRVRLERSNVHSIVGWTIICLLSAATANSGKYIKCNKVVQDVRNQRGRDWTLWRHKPQISQIPCIVSFCHSRWK